MKVWNYIFIMTMVSFFLFLFGINTSMGFVIQIINAIIGNPLGWESLSIFALIFVALGLAAGGGAILIGTFSRASPESYILAPVAIFLLNFVMDAVFVLSHVKGMVNNSPDMYWLYLVVVGFFAPIIIGYILAVAEWWRGSD